VAPIMRDDFVVAEPTEMLDVVFQRLAECECHTLPVIEEGRLLGLITMDNLGEYLLIRAALRQNDPVSKLTNTRPHFAVWKS